MARVLLAATAFPDFDPAEVLDPGLEHFDLHVQRIVESQNWLIGRLGKPHLAQGWPGRTGAAGEPTENPGRFEATALGWTRVVSQPIMPRAAMAGLVWVIRTCSDGQHRVRVSCLEDGSAQTSANLAAGVRWWNPADATPAAVAFVAPRGDTLTTIEIELERQAGGTYVDLLGCYLYDANLTAATLP